MPIIGARGLSAPGLTHFATPVAAGANCLCLIHEHLFRLQVAVFSRLAEFGRFFPFKCAALCMSCATGVCLMLCAAVPEHLTVCCCPKHLYPVRRFHTSCNILAMKGDERLNGSGSSWKRWLAVDPSIMILPHYASPLTVDTNQTWPFAALSDRAELGQNINTSKSTSQHAYVACIGFFWCQAPMVLQNPGG